MHKNEKIIKQYFEKNFPDYKLNETTMGFSAARKIDGEMIYYYIAYDEHMDILVLISTIDEAVSEDKHDMVNFYLNKLNSLSNYGFFYLIEQKNVVMYSYNHELNKKKVDFSLLDLIIEHANLQIDGVNSDLRYINDGATKEEITDAFQSD